MFGQVSINVRYLLWSRKIPRQGWEAWLASRSSVPGETCKRLVRGTLPDADLPDSHLRALANSLGLDVETLRYSHLPRDRGGVLAENLRFLFSSLGHGGKKSLASTLRIDPTTVSRWLSGAYEPQPASLRQLVSEFGLPADTNLQEDAVFLSTEPISAIERREWVNKRINALSSSEIRELFPALRRLLEER